MSNLYTYPDRAGPASGAAKTPVSPYPNVGVRQEEHGWQGVAISARPVWGWCACLHPVEDRAGDAPFEGASCAMAGVALGEPTLEGLLAGAVVGDLSQGNAMYRCVELPVAMSSGAHGPGIAGPVRDRGHPDVAGEGGLALEPLNTDHLGDDLGWGQLAAFTPAMERIWVLHRN